VRWRPVTFRNFYYRLNYEQSKVGQCGPVVWLLVLSVFACKITSMCPAATISEPCRRDTQKSCRLNSLHNTAAVASRAEQIATQKTGIYIVCPEKIKPQTVFDKNVKSQHILSKLSALNSEYTQWSKMSTFFSTVVSTNVGWFIQYLACVQNTKEICNITNINLSTSPTYCCHYLGKYMNCAIVTLTTKVTH